MENTGDFEKMLSQGEKIEYECGIGNQYRLVNFILWAMIFFALVMSTNNKGTVPGFLIFFLVIVFYFGVYLKKAYSYALANKRLLSKSGWLSTTMQSIDYDKITDIVIVDKLLKRVFYNVGTVIVHTAGTDSKELVMANIENPYEVKRKLEEIKERTSVHEQ